MPDWASNKKVGYTISRLMDQNRHACPRAVQEEMSSILKPEGAGDCELFYDDRDWLIKSEMGVARVKPV